MDTEEKYLDCEFFVWTVDGRKHNVPEDVNYRSRNKHSFGSMPEVDGWVMFFSREKFENDEPWKYFDFPFRSIEKDGDWFCLPDAEKGHRFPVWKWKNPNDPIGDITLDPSLGVGDIFHCWVKDGEIEWV